MKQEPKVNSNGMTKLSQANFDLLYKTKKVSAPPVLAPGIFNHKNLRTVYSHHGIYIGEGKVIEYNDGIVQESSLESFADGDSIIKVYEPSDYTKNEIVQRAKSRLGECDYNLVWNNCENFATWCRCGAEL